MGRGLMMSAIHALDASGHAPKSAERLSVGEPVGAAFQVDQLRRRVEAEPPEEGRGEVRGRHRVAVGVGAELVAGAEDLAALNAPAREHRAEAERPVVAPGGRVDLGRPAKLPRAR